MDVERIKQFYQDHKQAVTICAIGTGLVSTVMAIRFVNGQRMSSASFYMRDDEQAALIVVHKNNGQSKSFVKYRPKEVPQSA